MDHDVERYPSSRSFWLKRVAGAAIFFTAVLMFNNCGDPGSVHFDSVDPGAAASIVLPPAGPGVVPSVDPAQKFSAVAGIYSNGSLQVVFPDGTYWSFGGYGIIQARTGKLSNAKDGKFSGEITGGTLSRGAFSGVYTEGVSFGGAAYQASSKAPPLLSNALGTFWGNSQDGDTPYLTFAANGGITGYSANLQCRFSGKVVARPSGLNVLQVTLTRSNCLNNGKSDTYVGIARAYGSLVHIVAVTADSAKAFTYEGYYESNQNN